MQRESQAYIGIISTLCLISRDSRFTVEDSDEALPSSSMPSHATAQPTPQYTHVYTVRLNPGNAIGNLTGRLTAVLHSTNGTQKDIDLGDIPCFADVHGDISALPRVISFGQVSQGSPVSETVLISGKDLDKVTVASPSPNISVVLGKVANGSGLSRPFGAPVPKDAPSDGVETVQATVTIRESAPVGPVSSSLVYNTPHKLYKCLCHNLVRRLDENGDTYEDITNSAQCRVQGKDSY